MGGNDGGGSRGAYMSEQGRGGFRLVKPYISVSFIIIVNQDSTTGITPYNWYGVSLRTL